MSYTLGQAARATGKAKPTIARAIALGRLSAVRADDGSWAIDPAELSRIYPLNGQEDVQELQHLPGQSARTNLAEVLVERDRLVAEQAETIRDLRRRLDVADEERRRLTMVLADRREAGSAVQPTMVGPAPASVWRRFLAWRK